MLGTQQQNDVAERRNHKLIDMVKSMISNKDLPLSLWSDALKTTMYILNRVPSKAVSKTPFELWYGWNSSLNHLHIWGYFVEVQIYNPHIKKLDPRTTSCYFIGYAMNFKGFRFYCPSRTPRIVEAKNAKFLEDYELSRSAFPKRIEFEDAKNSIELPLYREPLVIFEGNQTDIFEELPIQEQPACQKQVQIEPIAKAKGIRRSLRIRKPTISSDYIVYIS